MKKLLDVYLHEIYAGKLFHNDVGRLEFTYDPSYIAEKKPALSVSLPLQPETFKEKIAKPFFSGLLPDDQARKKIAMCLGISAENTFALLKAIGGECAGAVSLYPAGETPPAETSHDMVILDDITLNKIFSILSKRPLLAGEEGMRMSLAGAQTKLAIGFHEGNIALMKGTTPTTHILKPIIPDFTSSVYNEFFCMRLAKMIGIEVPDVEVHQINNTPYYIIERYDRLKDVNGKFHRLHQEDFCQALGVLPENKYEREGGPSITKSMELLKAYSAEPAVDQIKFIKRVIFNFIIGNADAHGKNFSLLYDKKIEAPTISPAYDLLSTTIYPELSLKMAMKIGSKYVPGEVELRHWHRIVMDNAIARKNMNTQLKTIASDCIEKSNELREILNMQYFNTDAFDKICTIIKSRATLIERAIAQNK